MFRRYAILSDKSDGGSSGGGGSGGGKGDEPAAPFSPEQLTALGTIVNGAFNEKANKKIAAAVAEAFGALKLNETIAAEIAKLKPAEPEPKPGEGKGEHAKPDAEIQRQLTKLAEDLEKEKAARQTALAEAAEMKRSHEFSGARQTLYELLKPHANETLHDVWVDNLIHHKRLKVEEGSPLLEVEYSPVKGMPKQKEFLPLEEAVTHLIASEEAKRFLPSPGTENGRGSPGPRGARRAGAPALDSKDPAERVRARLESLGINYDNEFGS